jgi:hypothetical protein
MKHAEELASYINDLFLVFGAPRILHSKCHESSSYKSKQTGITVKLVLQFKFIICHLSTFLHIILNICFSSIISFIFLFIISIRFLLKMILACRTICKILRKIKTNRKLIILIHYNFVEYSVSVDFIKQGWKKCMP